jgi:hypothetical protein
MRYKIVLWPMFDETLVIVSANYEHYDRKTDFVRHYQLKTRGPEWELDGLLRELADQVQAQTP